MYLPQEISNARVLITVKTYPLSYAKYGEPVCAAGLLNGKKWVRIYPLPGNFLSNDADYPKYSFISLDLTRNKKDFRPESYCPRMDIDIRLLKKLGTSKGWDARKNLVLREVFTSMQELISLAKGKEKKSLATLKPREVVDLVIEEDGRRVKEKPPARRKQEDLFETAGPEGTAAYPVRMPPYRYFYRFLTEGDARPRKLRIADGELGAYFWNCLKKTEGNKEEANRLLRKKYFDEFCSRKDLYLFVGTNKFFHNVHPDPFMIVGIFHPPKTLQPSLF